MAKSNQDEAIPMAIATPITPAMILPLPKEYGNETVISAYKCPDELPKQIDEKQLKQLRDQGFTTGLAKALIDNTNNFPLRIWIIDNSGSMSIPDGKRFVEKRKERMISTKTCTRWNEIQETVEYHVRLAGLLRAPTTFRMLNNPGLGEGSQKFSICESGDNMVTQDIDRAIHIMQRSAPRGTTPLTRHINEIREDIQAMESSLVREGKKVTIIIATDGLPTDAYGGGGEWENKNFVRALKSLEGLPVWIVVRLCTDDDSVVSFYNELDAQLEMSVEVLDDFFSEAKEVYKHNKWLNYTLPLHRCREMGYNHRLFDILDERKLTATELRDFSQLLFGNDLFDGVPDPDENWEGFLQSLKAMLEKEDLQYDPITKGAMPVISVHKLKSNYGNKGVGFGCGCGWQIC